MPQPLTMDQTRHLASSLGRLLTSPRRSQRRDACVLFLCLIGCRVQEALNVQCRAFINRDRTVRIETLKCGSRRVIPVPRALAKALHNLRGGRRTGGLFETAAGRSVNQRHVRRTWARLAHQLGLPPVRIHDLRHTAATWVYETSGHDILAVAQLLGHKDLRTTRRYIHRFDALRPYIPGAELDERSD